MKTKEEEKREIHNIITEYSSEEYRKLTLLQIIVEKLIDIKYLLKYREDKN